MRTSTVIGRTAAVAAVLVAVAAVAIIVFSGGTDYKVKALFQNASQIVTGDLVEVSGNSVGTVSDIALTPSGQAQLTLDITDSKYTPLREGTIATVRQASLSAIANRYVDLRLAPGGDSVPHIPDGGTIGTENTTSAVDLDQLFNTLDPPTRKAIQDVIQGSAAAWANPNQGAAAQRAWQYLNPAVASSSVLFRELNRDTNKFTNFIVKTGNLVSDIAVRQNDLSGLVKNLSVTTNALANQRVALGQSIQRLPGFMSLADTTFANLRVALDDLKPLVDTSKPVAPKLRALLEQLRPLAEQSVPTVTDLSNIVSRPGPNNDLIDLTKLGVPLAAVTVRNLNVNGKSRPGAFTQSTTALHNSTPELAVARPYAVDLTGWFEGYAHPGGYDANGAYSRVAPVVGAFSVASGNLSPISAVLRCVNAFGSGNLAACLGTAPASLQGGGALTDQQGDRCPGSMERGALWYPETGYPCDPTQVPTGP